MRMLIVVSDARTAMYVNGSPLKRSHGGRRCEVPLLEPLPGSGA
jgi:hypothetical protein